ncbi:MAG TPA: MFS transporter [Actinomycetota bacterium]|nr:MFS transporter [Actinomycetota bacterium]
MALTDAVETQTTPAARSGRGGSLGSWWVLGGAVVVLLVVMGWRFIADPSLSAPTRDPAWYTWRAQIILEDQPSEVAASWGPNELFAGGYRVTVPLAGALLQRVAGIDRYSFSAFLMLGIPILTGLALGAALYRSRRDPLVVLTTLLASAALFLTTPYVGYLDNITVLFLLALTIPFVHEARTSWGARTALFLIGIAAAFTHPTTCVVFGVCLMAIFGWHLLTSRFSLGAALRADAPMLLSVGLGMFAGLACWVVGIWGVSASLQEAALPPPYTAEFFTARLVEWVESLRPLVIVPFMVVAIASTIALSRRTREPARNEEQASIWWLLAFAGALTVATGAALPYYRFMNASAAPMALVGLGAAVAIRGLASRERPPAWVGAAGLALAAIALAWWQIDDGVELWQFLLVAGLGAVAAFRSFVSLDGTRAIAGALATLIVFGSLGAVLWDGLQRRWISETNQWANQGVRTALAAVHEVVSEAGPRPVVLIANSNDADDDTGTNTAYGWAKTFTNVFRTGLDGDQVRQQVTYLGTVEGFLAGEQTLGRSEGYDDATRRHFCELVGSATMPSCLDEPDDEPIEGRLEQYPDEPVAFVIGEYYGGLCNAGTCERDDPATADVDEQDESERALLEAAVADAIEVGPDVYVLQGDGLWTPPQDVVTAAQAAADDARVAFENHPSAFANLGHNLLVLVGLFFLMVLPGLLAMRWFEARTAIDRFAIVPGMSIVLTLIAGIAVLAVWRGPLTTAKGWTTVAVASGLGLALRFGDAWLRKPLASLATFFNGMFAVFSNRDFSILVGVQFLSQAGQGVIQGAIGKSIAFGGQQGFDIQNVPSADYLLKVVLALYLPYTLVSPFVGVFIDRFSRRRVVWWSNVVTAAIVAVLGTAVLIPLGDGTSEGNVGATIALVAALLGAQAVVRIVLAVKSAAMPGVLFGKDLLQGNALSQAGGALAQIVGIAFALGAGAVLPSFSIVLVGALVLVAAALFARQLQHVQARPRDTTFAEEASKVVRNVVAGIKEVASRPAAALGISSFQMLRYQFWGFGLFVFGLYAKNLVEGGDADTLALILSGLGGLVGGALGLVLAQKYKDRVPPVRLLLGSMVLLGIGTLVGGIAVSVAGFALMLFIGFFAFFVGKISTDTIMQQAMPDDFRGRAFALFDIAYNLGYIVPALILSFVWIEGSGARTRVVLTASGIVFLALTAAVAAWARRIREHFAPQDDIVEALQTADGSS